MRLFNIERPPRPRSSYLHLPLVHILVAIRRRRITYGFIRRHNSGSPHCELAVLLQGFFLPQIVMTVYNMFAPIKYNIMK